MSCKKDLLQFLQYVLAFFNIAFCAMSYFRVWKETETEILRPHDSTCKAKPCDYAGTISNENEVMEKIMGIIIVGIISAVLGVVFPWLKCARKEWAKKTGDMPCVDFVLMFSALLEAFAGFLMMIAFAVFVGRIDGPYGQGFWLCIGAFLNSMLIVGICLVWCSCLTSKVNP